MKQKPIKVFKAKFIKNLEGNEPVRIDMFIDESKPELARWAIVEPPVSNLFGTRYSIHVSYYEQDKSYSVYSFGITGTSKKNAIDMIIERMKEHNFQFV